MCHWGSRGLQTLGSEGLRTSPQWRILVLWGGVPGPRSMDLWKLQDDKAVMAAGRHLEANGMLWKLLIDKDDLQIQ